MRDFDTLVKTSIYEKMDEETKETLRTAYDILCSDHFGLGNTEASVSEIGVTKDGLNRMVMAGNNIECNYERFMYRQDEVELMCDFLDIPVDRYIFFRTTMNLIARTVRHTTKIWK